MFGTRRREQRAILEAGFRPEWRDIVAERVGAWPHLDGDERARLELLTVRLIAEKSWEPANGFELTDDIKVTIAAGASLIALGLPDDVYRGVNAIVVHPTTLVLTGEHSMVNGIVSSDPMPILGRAEYSGPVLIVWDQALAEARHPGRGHNVVYHEFAHKIDMVDGTIDGTPPLASDEQFDRWVEVCTAVYHDIVAGRGGHSLSSYAGVNVAEFFAVATEAFFDRPDLLRREHADLYEVLSDFYRQDPAARLHRPEATSERGAT